MIICRHSDIVIQYSSQYGHVSKSRAGICAQGACRTSTLCAATKPRSTAILRLRSNQDDKMQENQLNQVMIQASTKLIEDLCSSLSSPL